MAKNITITLTEKQAKELERIVLWHASGKAKSNIEWKIYNKVAEANV